MHDPEKTGTGPEVEALSPEAMALMRRARRSFAVAIGVLLLGFMAIGFALVYRVMRDAPPTVVAESVVLPAGAEVVSAVLADGAVNVTYRAGGETVLVLFDHVTGEELRRVVIGAE
ncbi:DUF6476 family protein [Devosia albogilva]|uniref:DUF6476 family protein n=1 Tax=Devosia albogilva TaxID=429726 RepID=A0ABW5QI07_9HYPH